MEKKQSGLAIASLVLGIIGLLSSCIVVGIVPCIIALVLAIITLTKKDVKHGLATAGLICSAIGIGIFAFMFFVIDTEMENDQITQESNLNDEEISEPTATEELIPEPTKEPEETKTPTGIPTEKMKKEIIFMDTPWGVSYEEVNKKFPDYNLMCLAGEHYKTMSCDDILLGDYNGIEFEYSDINIIGSALNKEVEIAGYVTSDLKFYFSYTPVDGVITKTEKDTAFYGAQYVFSPKNLKNMQKDLLEKLTSLYGEPSESNTDSDLWGNKFTYTYWYGASDTELVLKTQDTSDDSTEIYEDEITISYVWRKGDELLQNASDLLKEQAIKEEAEAYDNTNTDGL